MDHGLACPTDRFALRLTVVFFVQTRGRTLEELENDFREHDAAHFVHQAPAGVHGL
jgi:hypothetical protein